ncbi:asialoglycoprotein receptor 2-like [Pelobates fuscus]|uniref:asialoglycoprotein receptor 2-like n=1 Tax=Pelobates fuscus TaxID=191477 RepID=UPI002FE481CC
MRDLPADVLLGNDLAPLVSAYAPMGPADVNPVTTRAQTRADECVRPAAETQDIDNHGAGEVKPLASTENKEYTDLFTNRELPALPVDENGDVETAANNGNLTLKCGSFIWRKDKLGWLIFAFGIFLVLMFILWLILVIVVIKYYSRISVEILDVKKNNNETMQTVFQLQIQQESILAEMQTTYNNTVSQVLQSHKNLLAEITKISNIDRTLTPCPSSWTCIGKYAYHFSTEPLNLEAAKADCISRQSQVLILADKTEMDALKFMMTGKSYWIGLIRNYMGWKWVDGTSPSFTSWSQNEPNNAGSRENCVEIKSGLWNDIDCTIKNNFVCKKM